MHAYIAGIEYFLPDFSLDTATLAAMFPSWSMEALDAKTGIHTRRIASDEQCASDLAFQASVKLLESGLCSADQIDFIVLCTQSPDYLLPTTACLLQHRLGIPTCAGSFDINLGCSGFVYGLGICEGLIASEQASTILLLTAETYSKYIGRSDRSCRTLFGDGAAAILVKSCSAFSMGPFVYGTDGRGADNLILRNSASRRESELSGSAVANNLESTRSNLFMNGSAVFNFAVEVVPSAVRTLLLKAGLTFDDIALFVFHQANAFLLEEIRNILEIPKDKLQIAFEHCGNTVSSTIPIALKRACLDGKLIDGDKIVLLGFGVGYSWAGTIINWSNVRLD